ALLVFYRSRAPPLLHSFPTRRSSDLIGLLAGSVCYGAVMLRDRLKWDDALDVWAAHGVGGLMGTILLGAFAFLSVNTAGADGLRSEEHTSELQSLRHLVCRLLLEKKK